MLRIGRGNKHEPQQRGTNAQPTNAQPANAPTNAQPADNNLRAANAQPPGVRPNAAAADMQGEARAETAGAERFASAQHAVGAQPVAASPLAAVSPQGALSPSPSSPRAVTESESLARAVKDGGVGGFVGGTSVLSGEVNFRGMMRVDGRVSGHVRSDDGTLIVSAGGKVEAEVSVAVAKINGTVEGDITATVRVELGRTARVSGNVQTPALVIEEGAIFEGTCRMKAAIASPSRARNAA